MLYSENCLHPEHMLLCIKRNQCPSLSASVGTTPESEAKCCCRRSWSCWSEKILEADMSPSPLWHVSGVNLKETADAFGCAMALCAARTGGGAMTLLSPVAQAWDDATAEGEGYAPREHHHGRRWAPRAV